MRESEKIYTRGVAEWKRRNELERNIRRRKGVRVRKRDRKRYAEERERYSKKTKKRDMYI